MSHLFGTANKPTDQLLEITYFSTQWSTSFSLGWAFSALFAPALLPRHSVAKQTEPTEQQRVPANRDSPLHLLCACVNSHKLWHLAHLFILACWAGALPASALWLMLGLLKQDFSGRASNFSLGFLFPCLPALLLVSSTLLPRLEENTISCH